MRKILRKGISLLLAVVMIAGLGIVTIPKVNAAEKTTFKIKTSASAVRPGDIIDAELWLEPGSDIEYFVLNFQYDTDVYEYVPKTNKKGDLLKELSMAFVDFDDGNISIVADLSECAELDLAPYGQLYKIQLKVKEDAVGTGEFGVDFRGGSNVDGSKLEGQDAIDTVVKDEKDNPIEGGKLPVIIDIKSLELNKKEAFIMVRGSEDDLSVTATPEGALDGKTIIWSSSNEKAVQVDNNGHIKAVGGGEAIITAEVEGKTASVKINVDAPLISVSLSEAEVEVLKNKSKTIAVSLNPEDTTDSKEVVWRLNDPSIAEMTVSEDGNSVTVKGLRQGEAVITAASVANPELKAVCTVKVKEIPLEGISLSEKSVRLTTRDTHQLSIKYSDEDTTDDKTVTWKSTDPEVATVDENGLVTARNEGIATVTATTKDGRFSASCKVIVEGVALKEILLDKNTPKEMTEGEKHTLAVILNPEDTTETVELNYASSNEAVAIVSKDGIVEALKEGTSVITVTATAGENVWTTSYELTVKKKLSSGNEEGKKPENQENQKPEAGKNEPNQNKAPNTGDVNSMSSAIMAMIFAGAAISIILGIRRKRVCR